MGRVQGRVTRKNTGSTVKIPVISYTSNTTYFNMPTTTYNTTTNNYYNQYEVNNITYNSTYNVYNVQTTENNYYITYSPTYVTVTNFNHVDKSVSTEELYYKTPDGRNSFYCLASDMEGVTYLYDVKKRKWGWKMTERRWACGIWMEIFMNPVTGAILLQLLLFSLILPVGTVLSNITIIQCRRGRST